MKEFYESRKEQGRNDFEVIFCSWDQTETEYLNSFAEMPWLALIYGSSAIKQLASMYDVTAAPTLVIVDWQGHLVNRRCRLCIENDPSGLRFPYYPEPAQDLGESVESYGFDMNTKPSLVVLMEHSSVQQQTAIKDILSAFGEKMTKDKVSSPEGPEMLFFYACKSSINSKRVRVLCRLPQINSEDTTAQPAVMVLLNVPDGGTFYLADDMVATETGDEAVNDISNMRVSTFITAFMGDALPKRKLR